MNEIDELLNFDPLATAEKVTGDSYKESKDTTGLGFLLIQGHAKVMKEKMQELDDTYPNMPFEDACRIFTDTMGFVLVHEHEFDGRFSDADEPRPETYRLYWRSGVLLEVDSYYDKVSSTTAYFNFRPRDVEARNEAYRVPTSHHVHADSYDRLGETVYIANLDGRTGLRHNLDHLTCLGVFCDPWLEPAFHSLSDYAEERRPDGVDLWQWMDRLKDVTKARLDTLPPHIRAAIGQPSE